MTYKSRIFILVGILFLGLGGILFVMYFQKETPTPDPLIPASGGALENRFRVNWIGHWMKEDLRETLVREVAKEFEFENPEIDVNLRFTDEIFGARSHELSANHIVQMIREKKYDWDIIWLDSFIYQVVGEILDDPEWGARYLVNFKNIPEFRSAHKPFILSDPTYAEQTGNILIGPYIEGFYLTLWYNQDVADLLGLTIKVHGMTFDDFLGYVKAVYDYNLTAKNRIAALHDTADFNGNSNLLQALVLSQFTNFNEAVESRSSPAKRDAFRVALDKFEELGQYVPLAPDNRKITRHEARILPLEDKVLFYVGGTWMYSHWRGLDPDKTHKMKLAELPVLKEVNHYLGGYIPTWAVFKDAPNRGNAIKLLMHWSRPDVAERWVAYTKNPTGLRGNLEQAGGFGTDAYERFLASINHKYEGRIHYAHTLSYIFGPKKGFKKSILEENLRLLLEGKISSEEVYNKYVQEGRGEL